MDRLPPEILSHIIYALSKDSHLPLAPYATISHRFRAAVEEQTFKRLVITTHDLPQLRKVFNDSNVYRRRFLSRILFRFVLPDEVPNPCCEAGRIIDREADSSSFTESVKALFEIIHNASKSCLTSLPPLYLRFVNAFRNSDPPYRNYGWCNREERKHDEDDEIRARAERGFYDFTPIAIEKLPILDDITEFDFGGGDDLEDLGRQWIGLVLGHLPALEILSMDLTDRLELGLGVRKSMREDLISSLVCLPLTHLKHFTLTIRSTRLDDEAKLPPDLVYTSTLLKPLATIAHLTKLHLDGPHIITPDFFSSLPPTAFPALKYFHLDFAPESANGQWFFERDEAWIANLSNEDIDSGSESSSSESSSSESSSSESSSSESSSSESSSSESDDDEENDNGFGDTEEIRLLPVVGRNPKYQGPVSQSRSRPNHFRTFPSTKTITPLLLAAAEMAKNAPCLRKFVMQVRDGLNPNSEVNTHYVHPQLKRAFLLVLLRPGELCSNPNLKLAFDEERYNDKHRMWWRVGDRWRPSKSILNAWKECVGEMGTVGFLAEESFGKDEGFGRFIEYFLGDPEIA